MAVLIIIAVIGFFISVSIPSFYGWGGRNYLTGHGYSFGVAWDRKENTCIGEYKFNREIRLTIW